MYKNILSIVFLLLSGFHTVSAHAGQMNFPGAMCVKRVAIDPFVTTQMQSGPVFVFPAAGLFNTSGMRTLHVDCPIIKTGFGATPFNGEPIIASWATVLDLNESSPVCARLISMDGIGAWDRIVGPLVCTSMTEDHTQHLDTGNLDIGDDSSYYFISLSIPPADGGQRSGILFYGAIQ